MQEKQGQVAALPYAWPYDASLSPTTTALVIIDMQRDCEYGTPFLLFQGT